MSIRVLTGGYRCDSMDCSAIIDGPKGPPFKPALKIAKAAGWTTERSRRGNMGWAHYCAACTARISEQIRCQRGSRRYWGA
jgi:hypothetical protein